MTPSRRAATPPPSYHLPLGDLWGRRGPPLLKVFTQKALKYSVPGYLLGEGRPKPSDVRPMYSARGLGWKGKGTGRKKARYQVAWPGGFFVCLVTTIYFNSWAGEDKQTICSEETKTLRQSRFVFRISSRDQLYVLHTPANQGAGIYPYLLFSFRPEQ